MRLEHPLPEIGPVVAGPDIRALIITQWPGPAARQGEKWGAVQDGIADDDFPARKF